MPFFIRRGFHTWRIGSHYYWRKIHWSWFLAVGSFNSSACTSQSCHIWHLLVFSNCEPGWGIWSSHCLYFRPFSTVRVAQATSKDCYCHSVLTLALIFSTSWGQEKAVWKVETAEVSSSLPLVNKVFPCEKQVPNLCPLMVQILSETLTHTNSHLDQLIVLMNTISLQVHQ